MRGASEPVLSMYSFLSRPTLLLLISGTFKLNLAFVSNILQLETTILVQTGLNKAILRC